MAAITQIRHAHSDGRAYYDKKVTEGKDAQGSAALPQATDQRRHLRPPAGRRPPGRRRTRGCGPGRATGERLCRQRGRLTPRTPALRTSHSRARHNPTARHPTPANRAAKADIEEDPPKSLTPTAKRTRYARYPERHGCCPQAGMAAKAQPLLASVCVWAGFGSAYWSVTADRGRARDSAVLARNAAAA